MRLDKWQISWRSMIEAPVVPPLQPLRDFASVSDETIFEAFATAAISGNTRWDRIAAIRDQLADPFLDFSPRNFAALDDHDIDERIVPWFRERHAGAPRLRAVLARLRDAARILGCNDTRTAAAFLEEARMSARQSAEEMAYLLGTAPRFKLPGFGIALAAEALRLLGCDLCKPDRHVMRAMGSWKLVQYRRWPEGKFAAPQARPGELLATMLAVRALATANDVSVSFANSTIWIAGAVSGARMTNPDLASLFDGKVSAQ
ncbi:hypothetical protein [Sphingomonas sp. PB4P5]|uniref:hypothetical protein n=1 Tax=Parasphingomonas puruogangriensis TaxID=3096155 RepID=UPI002FC5951B